MSNPKKSPQKKAVPYPAQPAWTPQLRMRLAREEAGLDQTELALKMELSRSTISNWERGETDFRNIRTRWLKDMAEILAVTPEWILTGDESIPRPAPLMAEVVRLPSGGLARSGKQRESAVTAQATRRYLSEDQSFGGAWAGDAQAECAA